MRRSCKKYSTMALWAPCPPTHKRNSVRISGKSDYPQRKARERILMNKYLIGLLLCACAAAQPIQNVAISKTPSSPSITTLTFYTSLGSPQYICKAPSLQPLYTWSVTPSSQQGTLTSIVVATNVGTVTTAANHGLQVNDVVVVAG